MKRWDVNDSIVFQAVRNLPHREEKTVASITRRIRDQWPTLIESHLTHRDEQSLERAIYRHLERLVALGDLNHGMKTQWNGRYGCSQANTYYVPVAA